MFREQLTHEVPVLHLGTAKVEAMNTVGGAGSATGGPSQTHSSAAAAAAVAAVAAAASGAGGAAGAGNSGKPEAGIGQDVVQRVVAAAKAAAEEQQRSAEDQRAVCDLCNVRRADLRGPCGHKYHARELLSSPPRQAPPGPLAPIAFPTLGCVHF